MAGCQCVLLEHVDLRLLSSGTCYCILFSASLSHITSIILSYEANLIGGMAHSYDGFLFMV